MQTFNISYIGAGPSTMFSLLRLLDEGYKGDICIIEKGKSLENRQPNELINGSFGSGCFSDSKLSSSLTVGGILPHLTQIELDYYNKWIPNSISRFLGEKNLLDWDTPKDFNTSPSSLKWDTHKTLHLGTDRGRKAYLNIEKYLRNYPNVKFYFETEVLDIVGLSNFDYQIIIKKQDGSQEALYSNKVVLATGQKSTLPNKIFKELNLKTLPRAFQLGVRVEDTINNQYEKIIESNYDFKFVKSFSYPNNVKVRVRTFCCNSGNAHTCAERVNGYTCFNGHAYKEKDPSNKTINYGLICEVEGLKDYSLKESQIYLMKQVNSLPTWEEDNFKNNIVKPKRKLLDGFPQLKGIYPEEVIKALEAFIEELNKIVDLNNAFYLYPEVKISGEIPNLTEHYETERPNLYMIGDCALSRGIVKASIMGIQLADYILKGDKNDTGN